MSLARTSRTDARSQGDDQLAERRPRAPHASDVLRDHLARAIDPS